MFIRLLMIGKLVVAAAVAAAALACADVAPATAQADTGQYCGNGVFAIGPTSCPFALIVDAASYNRPGMSNIVEVWSPVTGQNYWMNCVSVGSQIVCRGGDNATVLIT